MLQNLGPGEMILVDSDSVLCFESSVAIDVKAVGGFLTCCCSGQGLFNTTMTGKLSFPLKSTFIHQILIKFRLPFYRVIFFF
jgi:uncharacterized protein (AIM24 family)